MAFAQIGIIGFDGQIELEALLLYGLPEDAPAVLNALVDALGGTVVHMPATPATVWKALRAA